MRVSAKKSDRKQPRRDKLSEPARRVIDELSATGADRAPRRLGMSGRALPEPLGVAVAKPVFKGIDWLAFGLTVLVPSASARWQP